MIYEFNLVNNMLRKVHTDRSLNACTARCVPLRARRNNQATQLTTKQPNNQTTYQPNWPTYLHNFPHKACGKCAPHRPALQLQQKQLQQQQQQQHQEQLTACCMIFKCAMSYLCISHTLLVCASILTHRWPITTKYLKHLRNKLKLKSLYLFNTS